MPQVLVKLQPSTAAPQQSVMCSSPEERDAYVKLAHVWWYAYPEDDDMLWRQGGAWTAVLEAEPVALIEEDLRQIKTKMDEADDDRW